MREICRCGGVSGEKARTKRERLLSERGGALVETALSGALLLSVAIGMMQLFLALYGYHYVSYVAREGSRWAMVRGSQCSADSLTMTECNATSDQIQAYVQGLGFPGIDSSKVTATATWEAPSSSTPTTWSACTPMCNAPGDLVVVKVNYAFPLNIPFVSNTKLNMTSTSQLVISQ